MQRLSIFRQSDLSVVVDDDPGVDVEDDHGDDRHNSKAMGHIPVQHQPIEVPPLLGGLRGLLLLLVSLRGLVNGVSNPGVQHADDDGGEDQGHGVDNVQQLGDDVSED